MNDSQSIISDFFSAKRNKIEETTVFFKYLSKKKPKDFDRVIQREHESVFHVIDCLDCAHCCKSISPAVTDSDIARIAKFLKCKPSYVVETYFVLDADGDYVFTSLPCPFLGTDNYCSIYSARPRACREYPHTDRKKSLQLLAIHQKNCDVCPAVQLIFKNMRDKNYF